MPDDIAGQQAVGGNEQAFDIGSFLQGTSAEADTTGGAGAQGQPATSPEGQLAQGQSQQQAFTFGGRQFKSREEAEKTFNQLYGRHSENQGLLNAIRKGLQSGDPKILQALAQNRELAPILAKMGLQRAEDNLREEEPDREDFERQIEQLPAPLRQLHERLELRAARMELVDERRDFEEKLGRRVSGEELKATMAIIARAQELSFEEAWKLAHHDRLLREAHAKAQQTAARRPSAGNRPAPTNPFVPGVKLDTKKPVAEMSRDEWREALRNSPEFQKMVHER